MIKMTRIKINFEVAIELNGAQSRRLRSAEETYALHKRTEELLKELAQFE